MMADNLPKDGPQQIELNKNNKIEQNTHSLIRTNSARGMYESTSTKEAESAWVLICVRARCGCGWIG